MANSPIDFFIEYFRKIPKEQIEEYINQKKDLLPILKEALKMFALSLVKNLLRNHWNLVEEYLTDTNKVINLIVSVRPDLKETFSKKEAQIWLYENLKRIYDYLYEFTWK